MTEIHRRSPMRQWRMLLLLVLITAEDSSSGARRPTPKTHHQPVVAKAASLCTNPSHSAMEQGRARDRLATAQHAASDVHRALIERQVRSSHGENYFMQQQLRNEAISPQQYRTQGPDHARRLINRRSRRLQDDDGEPTDDPNELDDLPGTEPWSVGVDPVGSNYQDVAATLTAQPTSSWGALRIVWQTQHLYPTPNNPQPDGDRSCYAVGQWARRGDPPGDAPTAAAGCHGSCTPCSLV
eukprot:COSAG02_NODE_20914_length_810_cov_0.997187_1_plen_239_part_01